MNDPFRCSTVWSYAYNSIIYPHVSLPPTRVYQGVRNVSFLESFAYILNEIPNFEKYLI